MRPGIKGEVFKVILSKDYFSDNILNMTEKQQKVLTAFQSLKEEWVTPKELAEILLYSESAYISAPIKYLLDNGYIEANNRTGKFKKYRSK